MMNLKLLTKTIKELTLDLQAIVEEHDRYRLNSSSVDDAFGWLNSLPIESLKESLDKDYSNPRSKYSLSDMKHKFALRKLHDQKKEKLEDLKSKLNIAKIDELINIINNI